MPPQARGNARLKALMTEAGWSGDQLARSVNAIGAEAGMRLRYGRSSVAQWLRGAQPRQPVPPMLCESLTRALKRPVTLADIGMTEADPSGQQSLIDRLVALGDATRKATDAPGLEANIYSVMAACSTRIPAVFGRDGAAPRPPVKTADGSAQDTDGALSTAEALLAMFSTAVRRVGSGPMREALSQQLATMGSGWLRTADGSSYELHRAMSKLLYLCGFMCFDDGLQGLAQRYYALALKLSAGADDPAGYGRTLRSMSVQAHALGHSRVALQLAEASVDVAVHGGAQPGPGTAFLLSQLCVCHAATGNARDAMAQLDATERAYERTRESAPGPVGVFHAGELAHTRASVHALLGERSRAISSLRDAVRYLPAADRHSRIIWLARLATLQLRSGHLDEAVSTWHQFLGIYPTISSGRATSAFSSLPALIRPYRRHSHVRGLLERATALSSAHAPARPPRRNHDAFAHLGPVRPGYEPADSHGLQPAAHR